MANYPSVQGDLAWRVSTTCDGGACVMVARQGDSILLGNTSRPDGPVYSYSRAEWQEFLAAVKLGHFDEIDEID